MLKKYFNGFVVSVALFMVMIGGCGNKQIQSNWKQSAIVVDGQVSDWSGYSSEYYEKDDIHILLAIINDDSSLNMMIRFNDQYLARMFERRGIVLWFDGNCKKDKYYGVYYINPDAKNMIPPSFGMGGKRLPGVLERNQPLTPQGSFSLINQDTLRIPSIGISGLQAKAGLARGAYCYEFEIPLQQNEDSPLALFVSQQKKINVGVDIPPVDKEERARMEEMMADRNVQGRPLGGRAGSNGMPGGGKRGGGMPGGENRGPGGMMPDFDGKEIWFTVILASANGK